MFPVAEDDIQLDVVRVQHARAHRLGIRCSPRLSWKVCHPFENPGPRSAGASRRRARANGVMSGPLSTKTSPRVGYAAPYMQAIPPDIECPTTIGRSTPSAASS